ncbi:MAG: MEMO1 family protein [Candidatus Hydrothermarchaeales archaeon]
MVRSPSVAGQFYKSEPEGLKKQIESMFLHHLGPGKLPEEDGKRERDIVACVVPHAGYMYSGPAAAHVYFELARQKKPETIIILGPNHTGYGSGIATTKEPWNTPLGTVNIDEDVADSIWKGCDIVDMDETAHRSEHSLEVQIPFLQYIYGDFKFVPIVMGFQDLETADEIANCLSNIDKDILIVASSDFTHYESSKDAEYKDMKALNAILDLDAKKFINTVYDLNISICGYGPIAVAISAAKKIGATKAKLLKYMNSGDITGDKNQVVAYAGIVFQRG